jgi:hypothetical protein
MNSRSGCFCAAVCVAVLGGCVVPGGRSAAGGTGPRHACDLRTRAELSDYTETGRYDETVEFCRQLAAAAPVVHLTSFGTSAAGRPLPLLIVSRSRAFTPASVGRSGAPLVLIQCCIHAGECEGKDAALALVRDLVLGGVRSELLEHVNLLVMPIFNADGHERFGPYTRPNQNGPREAGWRATATNLNLNRDYLKADTPEMRAWLRCWMEWNPDLLIDTHTTNGTESRYDLFYSVTDDAAVDPAIANWCDQRLLPAVLAGLEADGHAVLEYCFPRNAQDLTQGFDAAVAFAPGYSTGYAALCNRPAILVETNARRPYRQRVRAVYDLLVRVLEELNRNPRALPDVVRQADASCAQRRGAGPDGRVVLRQRLADESEPVVYRGFESVIRDSDITGGPVVEYRDQPLDIQTRLFRRAEVVASVAPAEAYLIPPQWEGVIWRLWLHGVRYWRLAEPAELEVQAYRLEDVSYPSRPYEGRFRPQYRVVNHMMRMQFPARSVLVPVDQARAKVVAHLLEPEAPDSLVAWGFFNTIFEQKEYVEAYILEPLARQMLAEDPMLREEFARRLASDDSFAQNPSERLRFFYERSPFWDSNIGLYPVARVVDPNSLACLLAAARPGQQPPATDLP